MCICSPEVLKVVPIGAKTSGDSVSGVSQIIFGGIVGIVYDQLLPGSTIQRQIVPNCKRARWYQIDNPADFNRWVFFSKICCSSAIRQKWRRGKSLRHNEFLIRPWSGGADNPTGQAAFRLDQ